MISNNFDLAVVIILVCILFFYLIPGALKEWGWTFKRRKSQKKHYCVQIVNLPPHATATQLKRWFEGPAFLGAKVVADILSSECVGMGNVYFEDKNAAEAAIEDLSSDLGLSATLVEVDKPWSGFHFLSEKQELGRCKVVCYGVGSSIFGQF